MPHRKLPARRDSITSGAVLAQLAAVSSPDSPAAQIFPCDRTKFKESTLATRQSNGDGASTSTEAGPKPSHWELRGVAMIQIIAQPDDYLGNLEQELRAEAYEVQRATSIREASDAVSSLNYYPDVVLLDGGLSGPAERHMQNLKMFFNRSKTMVLGRFDKSGQALGITCIVAFRHGISDFMWYPSIGGLEELTARIERLLNNSHRAEVEATRQKAAAEKEEMMGRILRLREMQRQDAEAQKADNKDTPPGSPDASPGAFKHCGTLSSMTEEAGEDDLDEDELLEASLGV